MKTYYYIAKRRNPRTGNLAYAGGGFVEALNKKEARQLVSERYIGIVARSTVLRERKEI
jgi:hypothetical protein